MIKRISIILTIIMLGLACANTDKKVKSETNQTVKIDTITKFDPAKYEEEI